MDLGPMLRERHQQAMRSSRIRLGIMVAGLIVLIVVALKLSQWGQQRPSEEAAPAPAETVEEAEAEARKRPVDTKSLAKLPEQERPDFAPLAPGKDLRPIAVPKEDAEKKFPFLAEPKTLDEIVDQNGDLESRPLFYMLNRVLQDTQEALRAEAEANVDWPALWDNGAAWRGKAIHLRGEIVQMGEQPLPENPLGLTRLYAYRLRAENAPVHSKGHFYDVYALEKLKGALRLDKVAAYGRFLKARLSEAQHIEDPDFQVAVVVARALEPPTYLDEPRIPGPVVDGNRAEARPLYWLLKRAREVPFEELKAKANRKLTYLDFVNRPERYLGRPVAVRGQLRRLERVALPENRLDMPDIFYGQIADRDRKINTFYCIHVPEGVRHDDAVMLYGYFLKKWTYTSEGGYLVTSPIFVAQRLRVIDESALGSDRTLEVALLVALGATGIILGAALLVSHLRDRRAADARRARELALARQKLHRTSEKPHVPTLPTEK